MHSSHPPPTDPGHVLPGIDEAPASWSTWPRQGAPVSAREWGVRRKRASLARSAGIVAGAFVASRILGLVREIVLAQQFGTSAELSAYVSAFRIPDLLFLVIMAGAFGSAFIPVFSGFLGNGEDETAWKLASVVLNLSGASIILVSAVT
jgi:peptidoglycan biosynthesis protein MviN/MurJ (putative lipid II flippase)